nr:hypothetical protein [Tanacetum cinerariifolium]
MMAKLSDSEDIQCAGFDHDHYQEAAYAYHEEHMMHDCVQLDHVVDSHDEYTHDSNIIMCDQYVRDNEVSVVHSAIGYKNPLCLTRAKQAQPALYNGHEIIKENHIQAIVHNSEDTLEIAEITRKKMNDKMNDPKCVTHKDNFEGIQNALTKEVKEMKDVFEELEAEVAQHAVVRKHDAIELKNLLIANDNLIAECLSQEVFCVATNSELNVARFTDMHVANTTAETRCLALEAELANLRETNNQDNQMELITHFSKLETTDSQITKLTDQVTHLQAQNDLFRAKNEKAKQHYTELYDSIKIIRAKHIEQVTKVTTENMNLKIGVSKATVNPLVSARDKHAIDVEPIVPRLRNNRNAHLDYLRHLKESVEMIRDIIEEAKVKINVPVPPSTGVDCCPIASRSQPMSHVKPNTISPAKGDTKLPIDDKPRKNKSHL